jgi:hypothetical protein
MNSRQYIKEQLLSFVLENKLQNVEFTYKFDEDATHLIKISSIDCNEFTQFQNELITYIVDNHPNEDILFFTDEDDFSFFDMSNPEFVLTAGGMKSCGFNRTNLR